VFTESTFGAIIINGIVSPGVLTIWPAPRNRRPPRRETKQRNAWAKRIRHQLVRLAGWKTKAPELRMARIESAREYDGPTVSVPRSLRPVLGRYIGGTE
jgi:hypothetical protein